MMSQQKQITDFVINVFADLVTEWNFNEPLIQKEDSMTRISYLHSGDLGIELELDWREFEMFILIVRLENNNLPNGYYVSNGQKCRIHLANMVREQHWAVLRSSNNKVQRNKTTDFFQSSILAAKSLLIEHLPKIMSKGDAIFD